jgi:elongation factor Ts
MTISATTVKTLRERTNAPMMDCKAALTEAAGDLDKAVEILRKKNAGFQDKRGDRETAAGRIEIYIDPVAKVGAILEMRCESAPVTKTEQFVTLARDVVRQVALKNPASVEALLAQPFLDTPGKTVNERIGDVAGIIREVMRPTRFIRLNGLLGGYVHHDGSVGVLLQVEGAKADAQLLRDVCMHITARNPLSATREDIKADRVAKEKEIVAAQMKEDPKNANKPANILEKIAEGKLKTWFADNVLLEQPFVKDDSKTVGALLESAGLKLVKFVRFQVGQLS